MHPAGYRHSAARHVQGNTQVGYGHIYTNPFDLHTHGLLWHGTAASVVDLHPTTGYEHSFVYSIDGNSQVGFGQLELNGGPTHAIMWHGTAASIVNLHPAGFDSSIAQGVAGNTQVGYGYATGTDNYRALLWNNTAESVVDLHPYLAGLPVNLVNSYASKIAANGSIVGTARDSAFNSYAILWTPIPEPRSAALFLCGLLAVAVTCSRFSRTYA